MVLTEIDLDGNQKDLQNYEPPQVYKVLHGKTVMSRFALKEVLASSHTPGLQSWKIAEYRI